MGLDGGTYITRSDVIRGQSWRVSQADTSRSSRGGSVSSSKTYEQEKLEKKVQLQAKWGNCALSGDKLQKPIVADYLGNLYNKSAILEFLLSKKNVFVDDSSMIRYYNQQRASKFGFEHIKSIKDVFEVLLSDNQDENTDNQDFFPPYVCPVTDLRCGLHPFSAISRCGHVFADRAIKQMSENSCALCGIKFSNSKHIIPINGNKDQVLTQQKCLKKLELLKKRKKVEDEPSNVSDSNSDKKRIKLNQQEANPEDIF